MKQKPNKTVQPEKIKTRDDRLKAALKANMAKRKAQARAKTAAEQDKKGS